MSDGDLVSRIEALEAELAALEAERAVCRRALTAEVVDEAGRTRAMLATAAEGAISLNLLDEAGRLRAALGLAGGAPTLSLFDANGERRLDLHVGADDVPRMLLLDAGATNRLDAAVDEAGTATASLHDAKGGAKALLMATASGRGVAAASGPGGA